MSTPALPSYPTLVDLVKAALASKGRKDILEVTIGDGAKIGLGGGGASGNSKAKAITKDGKEVHLFVKTCRENGWEAKWQEMLGIFDNERNFFSIILPAMLGNAPNHPSSVYFPRYVGDGLVGKEINLVFEDFTVEFGHAPPGQDKYLDQADTKACMRGIGAIHALSRSSGNWNVVLAHRDLLQDDMCAERNEDYLTPRFCARGNRTLCILENVLKLKEVNVNVPPSITLETLARMKELSWKWLSILRVIRRPTNSQLDVLTHGDFHMWNVAMAAGRKPKIFDFQDVMYGPYACDLHHFLSQTVKTSDRRQLLPHFLDAYREGFLEACEDKEIASYWTKENVWKEYKARCPVGFVYGLNFVLARFVKEGMEDKLAAAATATDPMETAQLLEECGGKAIWETVDDMLSLVDEYLDFGVIDIMETALTAL